MDIKIPEEDAYLLNRKIIDIRSKLQLLESEMMYMPIKNVTEFISRVGHYSSEITKLRLMCSEALSLLNNHQITQKLFKG
jgi:hypothetical protein